MATRREARFKQCRRFGLNVYGHPKALKRVKKEQRQKKMSEYGTQLLEKQKLRAYYNLLERQFVRYYDKAKKMEGVTGENMLKLLECRLDNLVYRIGFANSIRQARQMVNHGHILVNGKRCDIPSAHVKVGSVITLKEASRANEMYKKSFHKNKLSLIVSPDGNAPAGMLQQAWFSIGEVEAGKKLGYHLHQSHAGVYIFLIEGEIKVDGTVLSRRDGMGVYETDSFELETLQDSHILLIEVPM